MRFRLPKPLNGWRVFAGEVGVIVLGVLIALGAQQAAEAFHWRNETNAVESALEEEIMDAVAVADERVAVSPCLERRIGQLGSKLALANGGWRADPMPVVDLNPSNAYVLPPAYQAPRRYLRSDAWDNAKASGVLSHMPRERASAYSAIYTQIAYLQELSDIETGEAPALAFLSYNGQIDEQSRERALGALARLDLINLHLVVGGLNLRKATEDLGLEFSPLQRKEVKEFFQLRLRQFGSCVKPPY
jgi:hypothetical protein